MRTVSFQGTQLSAGQRRRLQVERSIVANHYAPVDWDAFRDQVNSRMFVGPPAPIEIRPEFQPDRQAERFWRLAAEFKRYGYSEINQCGTPFVGDAFGCGQSIEVYV
jgi:hypothetical protein